MKKYLIGGSALLILLSVGFLFFSESVQRSIKDTQSNLLGGQNRTCVVYSETGKELRSYSGKYDLKFGNDHLHFDHDGKRTIVVGGTVICDEK